MQRRLDGFTLIELVGFGGTGEVWRAKPDGDGPEVALKWLTAETVDTEKLCGSGLRDFQHAHVARLLDLRRDGPSVVLVQEFVPGVCLAALLSERERLTSPEVVTLLTPVAEALGAAHSAGLLHGNLTPSAILLTPDGRPIVTDLGVWQSLDGTASATARLEYLDPSVARGESPTAASDVFGVAAIGFHALTGRPPWPAGTGVDSWELAAEGVAVDLTLLHSGPPARLADVIARGLSEHPDRRGSAQDFAADVRDCLEPEPLHLAGPCLWPDLPPAAESDSVPGEAAPMDIAGEVRRGSSARHAAAPGTRRERAPLADLVPGIGDMSQSRFRAAARIVPRRAIVAALVALAVLAVLVLGLGWNASNTVPARAGGPLGEPATESTADEAGSGSDGAGSGVDERAVPESPEAWAALLTLLYERRAVAFGTGAVELLDQVFTADGPGLIADSTELIRLADAGQVLRGFAPQVLEVSQATVDGSRAILQIIDEFAGYETVPALDTGAVALAEHPGRGPAPVAMMMMLTEDGWRIHTAQRVE